MATYSNEFTDAGVGTEFSVKKGNSFTYDVSGTFDLYWTLQKSTGGGYVALATSGSTASATVKADEDARYRFVAHTPGETPGTMTVAITELVDASRTLLVINAAGNSKAGATAGWVVAAGDDIALVTCPASQTASTLVVPISGLKVGQKITGVYATGQIESGGNTVTLDLDLRKHTAAAANVSDASVAAITQLSVAADTIISATNSRASEISETVAADETFYVLLTATTDASTDIALQSITLEIEE